MNMLLPDEWIENSIETYIYQHTTKSQILYWIVLFAVIVTLVALPFIYVDISIQGSKLISRSQLVDGPTIFERIANEPTSVNISFKLESKPNSVDLLNPYKLSSDVVINKEIGYGIAAELAELFRQIKAEDRVFEIENPILNDKFNIFNVVLESYSVTPERGSTVWEVSLDLLEVNTDYALLYVENSDGAQAEPPTAKTNV